MSTKTPGAASDLPPGFHGAPTPLDNFAPLGEDPDVVAAEHLLHWCRRNGFTVGGVVVGKVQIVGLVDQFPHKQPEPGTTPDRRYGFPGPTRK